MGLPTEQHCWLLENKPDKAIQKDTFKFETRPLPELKDGEVLVQVKFISNDPAQRGWMQKGADPKRLYAPPMNEGEIVRAYGLGTILASKSDKAKEGQYWYGPFGWTDYAVLPADKLLSPAHDLPGMQAASLSVLGMVSVTAYQGIFEILDVKPEHTVVVSGAAGAVGSCAVQLAKHVIGAKRVVGIAGGKEKCDWVKKLGADECVDYKDPNFAENLKKALPEECDRYYENVGGPILNTMLGLMKRYGKIGVCGMIATYNDRDVSNYPNMFEVVSNRLEIHGFIVVDMMLQGKYEEAVKNLGKWIKEGKITTDDKECVVDANVKECPEVWQRLFSGQNRGKLITKLTN